MFKLYEEISHILQHIYNFKKITLLIMPLSILYTFI